jgi:hypothetical protein
MSSYRDQTTWKRELREMREAEAREIREREERERAERERPILEATEALQATANELAKTTREKISTRVDDDFLGSLDQETKALKMPRAEAKQFNVEQFEIFKSQRPDAYWSTRNHVAVGDYLARNGFEIVPAKVLEAAWDRLSEYGLLESAPEPEPIAEPRPVQPEPLTAPESSAGEWGWNPDTGEREFKSHFLIAKMTADEYKRFVRIPRHQLDLVGVRR